MYLSGKFYVLLVLGLTFIPGKVNGQSAKIDSLRKVVATHSGIEKVDGLIGLSREYIMSYDRFDSALSNINQAMKISLELGDSLRIVKSIRIKGQSLRRLQEDDSAMFFLNNALTIARRNDFKGEVMNLVNSIGIIFLVKARYDEALDYFLEYLNLLEKGGDKEDLSFALNNIGVVFYKMKNYQKALNYFLQSLKIKKEFHYKYDLEVVLINCGLCYAFLDDFPSALTYINEGLSMCKLGCSGFGEMMGNFGKGVTYFRMNNLSSAYRFFETSFRLAQKNNDYRSQADNLVYLGRISFLMGRNGQGIEQLIEAERISQKVEYNELLLSVYEELNGMLRVAKKEEQLSTYQKKYIGLREDIYSARLRENLMDTETKMKSRDNTLILAQQREVMVMNKQLIGWQLVLITAIGAIVILLVVLLILLYRSNQFSKRFSGELEARVALRTQDLMKALEQLQEARVKQNLSIQCTHEIVWGHTLTMRGLCGVLWPDLNKVELKDGMELKLNHLVKVISKDLVGEGT